MFPWLASCEIRHGHLRLYALLDFPLTQAKIMCFHVHLVDKSEVPRLGSVKKIASLHMSKFHLLSQNIIKNLVYGKVLGLFRS